MQQTIDFQKVTFFKQKLKRNVYVIGFIGAILLHHHHYYYIITYYHHIIIIIIIIIMHTSPFFFCVRAVSCTLYNIKRPFPASL